MQQRRGAALAGVERCLDLDLAEMIEVVAGVEFAEAVGVDVEREVATRRGQREIDRDAQRRLELEVADAEHDGGQIEQLAEGVRGGSIRVAAGRERQRLGEMQFAQSIREARDAGGGIVARFADAEGSRSIDSRTQPQHNIGAEALKSKFAHRAAPSGAEPLDLEQIVAGRILAAVLALRRASGSDADDRHVAGLAGDREDRGFVGVAVEDQLGAVLGDRGRGTASRRAGRGGSGAPRGSVGGGSARRGSTRPRP